MARAFYIFLTDCGDNFSNALFDHRMVTNGTKGVFFVPENNERSAIRTLLFVMISVMLLYCAEGEGKPFYKKGGLEGLFPAPIKEVISWIVPA